MRNFFFIWLAVFTFCFADDSLFVHVNEEQFAAGVFGEKSDEIFVWFHGGMTSLNREKGLVAGRDFHELFGVSVLSSSAYENFHWNSQEAIMAVDFALDTLEKKWNVKFQKIHAVGVSDGALGVAVYSLYGKRPVDKRLLISGNLSFLGTPQELSANEKLSEGSWTFLQGAKDRLYPSEQTFPWIESFCSRPQINCQIHFDPQGEHDFSYWKEKRKEWLVEYANK